MPTADEQFRIKTEVFEGPLDLLLSLIEKRKLLINDISLAAVTDGYLSYLKDRGAFPIGDAANFILVAATLVLIKSKSLLPVLALTSEEEQSISDLEDRLKLYQRIKDLSIGIKERFGRNIIFRKTERKDPVIVFSPPEGLALSGIAAAMQGVVAGLPKPDIRPKATVRKVVSLEEMIGNLAERMAKTLKMSFFGFSGKGRETTEKVHVIISFLALLELVKRGAIEANQENAFSDISMETRELGVPQYT
jgi:segregation and condensation protein A